MVLIYGLLLYTDHYSLDLITIGSFIKLCNIARYSQCSEMKNLRFDINACLELKVNLQEYYKNFSKAFMAVEFT